MTPGLLTVSALIPTVLAAQSRSFYGSVMVLGFIVGILGHLVGSRWLVAIGLLLIFLGAFLLPLLNPPSPVRIPTNLVA